MIVDNSIVAFVISSTVILHGTAAYILRTDPKIEFYSNIQYFKLLIRQKSIFTVLWSITTLEPAIKVIMEWICPSFRRES